MIFFYKIKTPTKNQKLRCSCRFFCGSETSPMKETMVIYLLLWCFKGRYSKPCFFCAKKESPSSNYQIARFFCCQFLECNSPWTYGCSWFQIGLQVGSTLGNRFHTTELPASTTSCELDTCDSVKREIPQSHGGMNNCLPVNCDIWIWGNLPRSHSIPVPCREIYQLPFCPWMWQVFTVHVCETTPCLRSIWGWIAWMIQIAWLMVGH